MTQLNASDSSSNRASYDDDPQSMSLLSGVGRPEGLPNVDEMDFDESPSKKSTVNQGMVLILAIAVIAAGSLYAMRLSGTDLGSNKATKDAEAKIEQILAKLTQPATMKQDDPLLQANLQALFQDTDSIIATLSTDFTEYQVPLEFVQKNPFMLTLTQAKAPATNNSAAERERKLKQLQGELDRFKLQTVMNGQVPIAVINGEFYRQGQTLGSFNITNIDAKTLTVTLIAMNEQFTLSMNQGQ